MDFAGSERKLGIRLFGPLILLTCFVGGCYYDSVEALHPLNGYSNPCDTVQHAVYSQAIKTIISYNCLTCHNSSYAGGKVVLDSYDLVKQYTANGQIMNAILGKPGTYAMPPSQSLPICQSDKIQSWIQNNYPQ